MEIKKSNHQLAWEYLKKKLYKQGIILEILVTESKFKKRFEKVQKLNNGYINIYRKHMPVISYKQTEILKEYIENISEKKVKTLQKSLTQNLSKVGIKNDVAEEIIEIIEKETPLSYIKDLFNKKKKEKNTVKTEIIKIKAKELFPVQDELYLENVLQNFKKYGIPNKKNFITKRTMIVTKDNKIIDGHHRWCTAMLFKPNLYLETLKIDLTLEELYPLLIKYNTDNNIKRNN